MSATFPSLDLEALQYFVLHSGVFITILGACFFLLGFWCGRKATPRAPADAPTAAISASAPAPTLTPPAVPAKISGGSTINDAPNIKLGQETIVTAAPAQGLDSSASAPKPEAQIAPATEAHVADPDSAGKPHLTAPESSPIRATGPITEAEITPQSPHTAPLTTEPKPAAPKAEHPHPTEPVQEIPAERLPEPLPLFPEAEVEAAAEEPLSLPELPQDGVLKAITRSHGVQLPPTEAFSFLLLDAPPPPPRRRRPMPSPILFATHDGDMGRDDLTRIHGISAELEKKLNSLGVRHWQQIADWSPTEVRLVSCRLAFKDRIEREEWQRQARALTENDGSALTVPKIPEEPASTMGAQV